MRETVEPDLEAMVHDDGTVKLVLSGFPLQLAGPAGVFEEVKGVIALAPGEVEDFAVFVWNKGSGTGPQLILSRWVNRIDQLSSQVAHLVTADDAAVQLSPSRFCGCGSRLRSFKPWGNRRLIGIARPTIPWEYAGLSV